MFLNFFLRKFRLVEFHFNQLFNFFKKLFIGFLKFHGNLKRCFVGGIGDRIDFGGAAKTGLRIVFAAGQVGRHFASIERRHRSMAETLRQR